jgi:hypothetical protein
MSKTDQVYFHLLCLPSKTGALTGNAKGRTHGLQQELRSLVTLNECQPTTERRERIDVPLVYHLYQVGK